jgi:nitrile hydratase
MNGVHDLGGMHGLGRVPVDPHEPVFHAEWERLTFALIFGALGQRLFNIDEFRFARERMPPVHSLAARYYERMLYALELLLAEKGVLAPEAVETRARSFLESPDVDLPDRRDPELAERLLRSIATGIPASRPVEVGPRFNVGDRVRARNVHPTGHTRLARYVRGKRGVIARVYGAHVFPDSNAMGRGEDPQWLYAVRFEARELWGDSAEPGQAVYFDAWESYLEPADEG